MTDSQLNASFFFTNTHFVRNPLVINGLWRGVARLPKSLVMNDLQIFVGKSITCLVEQIDKLQVMFQIRKSYLLVYF